MEVIVMWGESSVLEVKHLAPARTYVVGEAVDDKGHAATDFMLSAASLGGREQLPLVVVDGDCLRLTITPEMRGCVDLNGQSVTLEQLRDRGSLTQSAEVIGAHEFVLPSESSAELQLGELRFIVRRVASMPIIAAVRPTFDWNSYGWVFGSVAFHLMFLAMFYFLPPQAAARNFDLTHEGQRYIDYVITQEEFVEPDEPNFVGDNAASDDGKAHDGDSGSMGKPTEKKSNNHHATAGDAKPDEEVLARANAEQVATSGGLIGILKMSAGSMDALTSPYGADKANGSDAINAIGAILGDRAGANFGWGGLGPVGTGRGGGGNGRGTVGTGEVATVGGMGGRGGHGPGGYGSTQGKLGGHEARVPRIIANPPEVRGGLSKEAIRRVIHRHLAEIRHCYEQELNSSPDLEGRVAVKFVINTSGAVQMANVAQSTLGNVRAESCISTAVTRWAFPSGTGMSIVSYPFMLTRAGE